MSPRNFLYMDDQGATRSVDIPHGLRSYAAEHLKALESLIERINRIVIPDVATPHQKSPTTVEAGPSGPVDGVASEGTEHHTAPVATGYIDPLDGLTVVEAEFLDDLGWADNDLTSEEEAFLREYGLDEPEHVTYEEGSSSEAALVPETPLVHSHDVDCKRSFPWNCTSNAGPLPILSDPTFGPVGTAPPTRRRTSEPRVPPASSSDSPAAAPPTRASVPTTPLRIPAVTLAAARSGYFVWIQRVWEQQEKTLSILAQRLEEQRRVEALEQAIMVEETNQAVDRYWTYRKQLFREQYSLGVIQYGEYPASFLVADATAERIARVEDEALRMPLRN
ncbi:uncharacterized protein EKO05_0003852 [Ascochyta rabiei]|uniref:Uncharacterized protein n=1 Tax=Didymella rabiei TaxID=5454 RepID=A0A163C092_DIDRA|nr:uncharacterized protein EKO05_0003852 [Ascochyta rabiei]KZM22125.1 hypothetical protein ST47_g6711 [Ascochyta rabiei]UPX13337.1 hypothetical protein EKO05_0003852 [Ascochyta rabiei]